MKNWQIAALVAGAVLLAFIVEGKSGGKITGALRKIPGLGTLF